MTLKDVAKVSGCSVATVSKVFKNSAEISAETKERVLEAAKSIGYLKKATTRPAVLGGKKPVVFSDPKNIYMSQLGDIKRAAQRQGLTLVYVMLDDENALELTEQIGAWGLITAGSTRLEAENVVAFTGDLKELTEEFKTMANFVPKRASRSKVDVTVKPARQEKPKEIERPAKKEEDIWLL